MHMCKLYRKTKLTTVHAQAFKSHTFSNSKVHKNLLHRVDTVQYSYIIIFLYIQTKYRDELANLKGLSHEIDFKNFDKNLQNLV